MEIEHGRDSNRLLESLPPEIRRWTLMLLDLPRLKALVFSSAEFHQQYLLDRRLLLCTGLEETLGSAAIEAYMAQQLNAQKQGAMQHATTDFLKSYLEILPRRHLSLTDKLTTDDAISMANVYFRHIQPLVQHYARWMLDKISLQTNHQTRALPHELSATEKMRLTRALYRFQLLCDMVDARVGLSEKVVEAFLNILEPWEVEELLSFYQFTHQVYDEVFEEIRWDLHPDNPKFDDQGRPPTPEGAFNLDNRGQRQNYLEGTALYGGLPLLHTIIMKRDNHEELVSIMQPHIRSSYIPLNTEEGVFGETHQALRRSNNRSERDEKQEQRAPLPFRGDGEPDAPPLAWVLLWNETYSNLFGWYIPDELRRWGYIFWDAATLEEVGGVDELKREWKEYWDDDPRDDVF